MNNRLYQYYVIDKKHRELRVQQAQPVADEYSRQGLSSSERMTARFEYVSSLEGPHIHPEEKIVLMRTVPTLPDVYTEEEWQEI